MAEKIPCWLISYNDRSYPSVADFEKIISKYKEVSIEHKTYSNGRGGKGSVAGSKEVLFVCYPKKKHFITSNKEATTVDERI
jgi:adenine-specific DNA methylase